MGRGGRRRRRKEEGIFYIVETDTVNGKPSETGIVVITPSRTTNVLLKTKPASPTATFIMAAACHTLLYRASILGPESHPLHLHGFNFFVAGEGFGNYDPNNDPSKFKLVDPAERNAVGVPSGGWIAIRLFTDNPGVWFMHCHFDVHKSWGLRMASWICTCCKLI
ncbi:unnamed protein product [Coffea canephora]|uniref:Plastocyanin-like domain-containing protein n=1 Tax=Coffea canephora TaxID=49390 RepID=A0A068UR26_COFCA|nr:unnamed protein product [Coffea canephora]